MDFPTQHCPFYWLRRLFPLLVAIGLTNSIGAQPSPKGEVDVSEVAPLQPWTQQAYSLNGQWQALWNRFLDRSGRPKPYGPLLQHIHPEVYPEYEFELYQSDYPLAWQRAWENQTSGARAYVQSVDEFTLINATQMKTRVPMLGPTYLGLDYTRLQTINTQSNLFRMDFGYDQGPDKSSWLFVHSFYPRWEKTDSDMQSLVGYRFLKYGTIQSRLYYFDPFTNAALALAESRTDPIETKVKQIQPAVAQTIEISTVSLGGWRSELYVGHFYPARTRRSFRGQPRETHYLEWDGLLAGALVEHGFQKLPATVGFTYLNVATELKRSYVRSPQRDKTIRENTHEGKLYALVEILPNWSAETFVQYTERPEQIVRRTVFKISDKQWLYSIRSVYMVGRIFGFELGHLILMRQRTDRFSVLVNGTNNRTLTRFVFQFGPRVWLAFGVGWDTDADRTSIYDGGGLTMQAQF